MLMQDIKIQQRSSVVGNVLSPSREMLPFLRGGGTPTVLSNMTMGNRLIPARPPITSGIGDTALRLPTSRGAVSQLAGNRAGVLPPSTLAIGRTNGGGISTASAFGGTSGGMGAGGGFLPDTAIGPSSLSGITSSLTSAGSGIINTIGSLVPLAIKIILAVIVIKIVLWLVRGRRR